MFFLFFVESEQSAGKGDMMAKFLNLTQEDVELMMDHINSYRRKKLNGKSPYEAFCFYYGEDLAERLDATRLAPTTSISRGTSKKVTR